MKESVSQKMPSVVFMFSELKKESGTRIRPTDKPLKEEYTDAAKRSLDVYTKIFGADSDRRLKVLTRFFRCFKMDLTKFESGNHPDVSEAKTPMILILDANGKVICVLEQQQIDSRSLILGMYNTLKASGLKTIDATCDSMLQVMDKMEKALVAKSKLQDQMDERKKNLEEAKAKDQKRASSKSRSQGTSDETKRAEQAIIQLQLALDSATRACEELVKQDEEFIRKSRIETN